MQNSKKTLIVTDSNVPKEIVENVKKQFKNAMIFEFKTGEESKTFSTAMQIIDVLIQNEFSNSIKAEKLAGYLVHAFDLLAQKFYNEQDLKQGYILMSDDDIEETPVPIVTTSIALVSNEYKQYTNLKDAKLTPNDLECIVTDIGPGSFTGIRACVTVARMLAQQLNIKVVGVSSLEILSKSKILLCFCNLIGNIFEFFF